MPSTVFPLRLSGFVALKIPSAEFALGLTGAKDIPTAMDIIYEKYKPDFVINSIHCDGGRDYAYSSITQDKPTLYGRYLRLIRESLDAPYPYDIVGHIGYVMRYAPFDDKEIDLNEFKKPLDDILTTIIQKDKILEVNTSSYGLSQSSLPGEPLLSLYYKLGGRKISFGSDAHKTDRLADKFEATASMLKGIGFEYLTIPYKKEHLKFPI
jgi:histidinol-phosphatase (PHP family)